MVEENERNETEGTDVNQGAEHAGTSAEQQDAAAEDVTNTDAIRERRQEEAAEGLTEEDPIGDFFDIDWDERLELVSDYEGGDDVMEAGTEITFDFHRNYAREFQTGFGDVLPAYVRSISNRGVSYQRRGDQGFFNRGGRSLMLMSGRKVVIGADNDSDYDGDNEFADIYGDSSEGESTFEVARRFLIDPYFLSAVTSVVPYTYIPHISTPDEFAHLAARYIQNAQAEFGFSESVKSGHFTGEFVGYALRRFNSFVGFHGLNEDAIKRVAEVYGASIHMKMEIPDENVDKGQTLESVHVELGDETAPESPEAFVRLATSMAKRLEPIYHIPWQVMVAQASLESNFGKATPGLNFFGIKATAKHKKRTAPTITHEFRNGKKVKEHAVFAAFDSMLDSFEGYGEFLTLGKTYDVEEQKFLGKGRYLATINEYGVHSGNRGNPRKCLEGIIGAGYATHPDYVAMAIKKVKPYGVYFDSFV